MTLPHRAYIALGANLGDPAAAIRLAFEVLADLDGVELLTTSSLYRTAPIGLADQPDFINAVAAVATDLDPQSLLALLLGIETAQGRIRHEKNGPRVLDLDLLLYDHLTLALPELTLPHPRLHLRAFVLHPLAEIAPDLPIPGRGSVSAWLPAVALQSIERLQ